MPTVYVATGGDNGRTYVQAQSASTPWATLSHAMTNSVAGDTIELRGGTFAQSFTQDQQDRIVQNYSGEAVIFERTSSGGVITMQDCKTITIRVNPGGGSFEVRSTVSGNGSSTGVYFSNPGGGTYTPENNVVDGLVVHDIAGYGIYHNTGLNPTVQNCEVYECGMGIRFLGCTDGYIQDNEVHTMDRMIVSDATPSNDNGGLGIAVDANSGTRCGGTIIQRNLIHGCHADSIDYIEDGGALEFYGSDDCIWQDNICYDNEGFFETGTPSSVNNPSTGHIVRRNVVYGGLSYDATNNDTPGMLIRCGEDMQVYHNTFYISSANSGKDIIRVDQGGSFSADLTNLSIRNNIIVSQSATNKCLTINNQITDTGVVIDYNLMYNTTGSSADLATVDAGAGDVLYDGTELATFRTNTPFGDHDVWNVDPKFVAAGSQDFRLNSISPARNIGVVIAGGNDDYRGLAPDLGAYESARRHRMMTTS